MQRFAFSACAIGLLTLAGTSSAQVDGDISVRVTNEGNTDFFLTPVWFAFQDGGFDFFDVGTTASSSLEAIAEDGIVDGLIADFANSGQPGNRQGVAANAAGFGGAPIIDPGETAEAFITPINPAAYQYFSFASMIIPSNDAFIGNDNPLAYRVFNDMGEINDASGTFTIQIFGSDVWDSGTEQNLGNGAAFSTIGGDGVDEGGVVTAGSDLSALLGSTTPAGTTINSLIGSGDLLATIEISVVPAPGSALALGLAGLVGIRRRR